MSALNPFVLFLFLPFKEKLGQFTVTPDWFDLLLLFLDNKRFQTENPQNANWHITLSKDHFSTFYFKHGIFILFFRIFYFFCTKLTNIKIQGPLVIRGIYVSGFWIANFLANFSFGPVNSQMKSTRITRATCNVKAT